MKTSKGEGPKNISQLILKIYPTDRIWVDDDDTGKWLVLDYKQVYEPLAQYYKYNSRIIRQHRKRFRPSISVTNDNNVIAIILPRI